MKLKFVAVSLLLRLMLGCLKPRYLQNVESTTLGRYKRWVASKKKKLAVENPQMAARLNDDIEPIWGHDASLVWLGDRRKASKSVVFFHGGGYIAPITGGHLDWCWNSYVAGGPGDKDDVAVAIVQYTLCPQARYPVQLRQVCAGLAMVLEKGISPSNIIVGGDSAGGNLTGQVIRHLSEPHPGIQPIGLSEPIAGAFMVSPLVDGRPDTQSFRDNHSVDMIFSSLCVRSCDEMFHPRPGDMSIEEMRALELPMEGDPA